MARSSEYVEGIRRRGFSCIKVVWIVQSSRFSQSEIVSMTRLASMNIYKKFNLLYIYLAVFCLSHLLSCSDAPRILSSEGRRRSSRFQDYTLRVSFPNLNIWLGFKRSSKIVNALRDTLLLV